MGSLALEVRLGLAGRDGFADPELPLPQPGFELHERELDAPPVHDFCFGCEDGSFASSSASSFNKIWRAASSGASARHLLKRAKFSLRMNLSIDPLLDQAGAQHSQSPIGCRSRGGDSSIMSCPISDIKSKIPLQVNFQPKREPRVSAQRGCPDVLTPEFERTIRNCFRALQKLCNKLSVPNAFWGAASGL